MKKEIVSIVMSTTLLVNNVANPITIMADEVSNINNQVLEMTDEKNVENSEYSEGDRESLEIVEEENANEDIEKEDIKENKINTEDIKLLNEEKEVIKLEAGKSYEIRNIGENKISINTSIRLPFLPSMAICDFSSNAAYRTENINAKLADKITFLEKE